MERKIPDPQIRGADRGRYPKGIKGNPRTGTATADSRQRTAHSSSEILNLSPSPDSSSQIRVVARKVNLIGNARLLLDIENSDESPYTNVSIVEEGGGTQNQILSKCDSKKQVKVFMYDLPPEFHFELLGWKGKSIWPDIRSEVPDYTDGLNLQHSIEYWLTLDLLNSEFAENLSEKSAIRVSNSSEADVVFVPFFSSISFNRYSKLKPNQKRSTNVLLQEKLVNFLMAQEEWKRSTGPGEETI
ncbi:Exostosin family protein [Abeliophyllum distichum]|uniref:Exostosin family protein n=1 Tax=Abeliophyllum distichum TaxID=126358 RepID=A0ABD1SCL5_9LAMI